MRRVKLDKLEYLVLEDGVPIPQPAAAETIMKVERVGICGSDVHFYHGDYVGAKLPLVLGHEFSGTVHTLGSAVKDFRVGQHVTAEPGIGCGKCTYCLSGQYNFCRHQAFIGGRAENDGAYAEYVRVPADMLIPLPEDMSFDVGAMVEPTAVAMHVLGRGEIGSADRVLIIGAGTIGLLVVQAVRMAGAKSVVVADIVPERLALAKQLGADAAINAKETDLVTWVDKTYGEGGINRVFDAAGTAQTFAQALQIARRGGRVVNIAEGTKPVELNRDFLNGEIELTGSRQYVRADFHQAIDAITSHRIQVEPLVSAVYPLSQYQEAFEAALHNPKYIKIMLAPQLGQELSVGEKS